MLLHVFVWASESESVCVGERLGAELDRGRICIIRPGECLPVWEHWREGHTNAARMEDWG